MSGFGYDFCLWLFLDFSVYCFFFNFRQWRWPSTDDELAWTWCNSNQISLNPAKRHVVHFRPRLASCSNFNFNYGFGELTTVAKYVYSGITLSEYLNLSITATIVSQAASRALGLLIAKFKTIGGMPFDVYSKLYDSVVCPVISYGAAIWGDQTYSCIEAVQNRATRFFQGIGKYMPIAVVYGEMGWQPPLSRQWKSLCNIWARYSVLSDLRLYKRLFLYALRHRNSRCRIGYLE